MTKFLNLNDPSFLSQLGDTFSPEDVCDSENRDDGSSVPVAPDTHRMPAASFFSTAAVAFRSIASLPRNVSLGSLPATLEAANKPIVTEAIAGKAVAKKVLSRGIPYAWAPQLGYEAGQFLREALGIERTWGDLYDEWFHTVDADDFKNLEPEESEGAGWIGQVERPEVQIDAGGRVYSDILKELYQDGERWKKITEKRSEIEALRRINPFHANIRRLEGEIAQLINETRVSSSERHAIRAGETRGASVQGVSHEASDAVLADILRRRGPSWGLSPRYGTSPVEAVRSFLRGDLGVPPTHANVKDLHDRLFESRHSLLGSEFSEMIRTIFEGPDPIYQIYTREYLDAYAEYLFKLAADFRQHHGRAPVIVEVAAGSGRFTKALNQTLQGRLKVTATDLGKGDSRRWDIRTVAPVTVKDAVAATRDADIILGHWFPPREAQYHPPSWLPTEILDFFPDHDPDEMIAVDFGFDSGIVKIIQADPKKTLVYTGQLGGLTGSMMFEKRLERMQSLKPEGLNNFKHTHSNAAGENPTPLSRMNFYDNWSSGNAQTQVTVHRSTQAPPIPEFKTGETVNTPALPRSLFSTVEEWVRGFLS